MHDSVRPEGAAKAPAPAEGCLADAFRAGMLYARAAEVESCGPRAGQRIIGEVHGGGAPLAAGELPKGPSLRAAVRDLLGRERGGPRAEPSDDPAAALQVGDASLRGALTSMAAAVASVGAPRGAEAAADARGELRGAEVPLTRLAGGSATVRAHAVDLAAGEQDEGDGALIPRTHPWE